MTICQTVPTRYLYLCIRQPQYTATFDSEANIRSPATLAKEAALAHLPNHLLHAPHISVRSVSPQHCSQSRERLLFVSMQPRHLYSSTRRLTCSGFCRALRMGPLSGLHFDFALLAVQLCFTLQLPCIFSSQHEDVDLRLWFFAPSSSGREATLYQIRPSVKDTDSDRS